MTLRSLAQRIQSLDDEMTAINAVLAPVVAQTAPALVALTGVGVECASALRVATGDNPPCLSG